jgi:capsular polysaccharide biosynthesis protein
VKNRNSVATRIYAWFLRFYPQRFRDEFGGEMKQLFTEQYFEARDAGFLSTASFWIRTTKDFSLSLIDQHLQYMNARSLLQYCTRHFTFSRLFVGMTVCLLSLCVITTLFVLPEVYMSRARILIRVPQEAVDPYQVQTMFEKIKSRKVLEPVIARLNLTSALAKEAGLKNELSSEEAYQMLLGMIELRQSRNTSLVEISVYSESRQLSAKIANEIVAMTMQTEATRFAEQATQPSNIQGDSEQIRPVDNVISRMAVIEEATPGLRPVRPNVPLNIVLGGILSVVAALVIAAFMRLMLKVVSPA